MYSTRRARESAGDTGRLLHIWLIPPFLAFRIFLVGGIHYRRSNYTCRSMNIQLFSPWVGQLLHIAS